MLEINEAILSRHCGIPGVSQLSFIISRAPHLDIFYQYFRVGFRRNDNFVKKLYG